eukprot:scaffold87385_cov33-Tisochrysis_lutea.AAC.2
MEALDCHTTLLDVHSHTLPSKLFVDCTVAFGPYSCLSSAQSLRKRGLFTSAGTYSANQSARRCGSKHRAVAGNLGIGHTAAARRGWAVPRPGR